jgi:hypothetical protein
MPQRVDSSSYQPPEGERPAVPAPIELERRAHDPYAAFRFGDFSLFTAGNLLSITGRLMLAVAVEWVEACAHILKADTESVSLTCDVHWRPHDKTKNAPHQCDWASNEENELRSVGVSALSAKKDATGKNDRADHSCYQ